MSSRNKVFPPPPNSFTIICFLLAWKGFCIVCLVYLNCHVVAHGNRPSYFLTPFFDKMHESFWRHNCVISLAHEYSSYSSRHFFFDIVCACKFLQIQKQIIASKHFIHCSRFEMNPTLFKNNLMLTEFDTLLIPDWICNHFCDHVSFFPVSEFWYIHMRVWHAFSYQNTTIDVHNIKIYWCFTLVHFNK